LYNKQQEKTFRKESKPFRKWWRKAEFEAKQSDDDDDEEVEEEE
jgi:hypothetical protein